MSSAPEWRRVLDDLADRIAGGEYGPGQKLPSLPELRRSYGVSTSTIQKALNVLDYLGKIEPRQGVGYFVLDPNPDQGSDPP
jgi:GntR family transcriptional regulator